MGIPIKLEVFEGPLDLLLHLIDKNKVDIYDIPIVEITNQYMEYIHQMQREDLNIMSEFLLMAATLLDIKCKMLLPKEVNEEGEEEEPEYDEHVWLSVKNAEVLSKAIADALEKADPDHKDIYQENASAYSEKLKDLDAKYQEVVDGASQKTLLFGDRFPFRYLVDDYGLSYYAAFVGCSAESEASFDTISFLANKVDELGLKDIMAIENSNQKIAKTIIENTKEKNQKILTLDTMQSTTSDDVKNGTTYLSVMEKNLEVLKEALQ